MLHFLADRIRGEQKAEINIARRDRGESNPGYIRRPNAISSYPE